MKARHFLLLIVFLAIIPLALSVSKLDLYGETLESRGMMLYWAAIIILLAMPFINKHLKVLGLYAVVLVLSRGIMRLTDEQNPVRAWVSMEPGFDLGLKIAVPLLAISAAWFAVIFIIRQASASKELSEEELRELSQRAVLAGKDETEYLLEMQDTGHSEEACKSLLKEYRKIREKQGIEA